MSRSILVLLATMVAGCDDGRGIPARLPTTAPVLGDSLVLVETLRLGQIDGDGALTFSYVQDVAPALDGSFYVADRDSREIRHFAADGAFLGSFGGVGDGPGEFQYLGKIGVRANGSVVAIDGRTGRVSTFTPEGESTSSVPAPGINAAPGIAAIGANGDVYSWITKFNGAQRVLDDRGIIEWASLHDWAAVSPSGEISILGAIPYADAIGPTYFVDGRGGLYKPLVTETVSTIGPDGARYWARNDEYRVFRLGLDGDTTVFERNEEPVEATSAELAQWEARSQQYVERSPARRERYFPIPTVKPLIRNLAIDADGRLWVSRYTDAVFMQYTDQERTYREERGYADHQWRDLPSWDVFAPEGAFLGTVSLPMKTSFVTARGMTVWGIQEGPLGEDSVVRWTIEAR